MKRRYPIEIPYKEGPMLMPRWHYMWSFDSIADTLVKIWSINNSRFNPISGDYVRPNTVIITEKRRQLEKSLAYNMDCSFCGNFTGVRLIVMEPLGYRWQRIKGKRNEGQRKGSKRPIIWVQVTHDHAHWSCLTCAVELSGRPQKLL